MPFFEDSECCSEILNYALYRSSRKTFIPFCSVGRQETTPFWVVATLPLLSFYFYVDLEIMFTIMQLQLTSTKPIPVNQI